ncbi:MAG: beta-class carbonic anhydrase [Suipraeoptans sp.]
MIEELIMYNKYFVTHELYTPYKTSKYPNRKTAILTCMDTRLTELLTASLNIKNGDAKIIRNAGSVILNDNDTIIRSILIAVLEFDIKDILVIGHTDCGVSKISQKNIINKLISRGVSSKDISEFSKRNKDFVNWFNGFDSEIDEIEKSVMTLKTHPLIPKDITIKGCLMDTKTGEVSVVI